MVQSCRMPLSWCPGPSRRDSRRAHDAHAHRQQLERAKPRLSCKLVARTARKPRCSLQDGACEPDGGGLTKSLPSRGEKALFGNAFPEKTFSLDFKRTFISHEHVQPP